MEKEVANLTTRLRAVGVEPPKTQTKPTTFLTTALDILDRPRAAVAGALAGEPGERLKGAVAGLTGKTHITGADLLKEWGLRPSTLTSIGGFLLDVALDPTTYLTFGIGSAAKGAATQAGKALVVRAGIPGTKAAVSAKVGLGPAEKLVQAVRQVPAVRGVEEALGTAFSTGYIRPSTISSPEELEKVMAGRKAIEELGRSVRGKREEALSRFQEVFRGVSREKAEQAGVLMETMEMRLANMPMAELRKLAEPLLSAEEVAKLKGKAGRVRLSQAIREAGILAQSIEDPEVARLVRLGQELRDATEMADIAAGVEFDRIPAYLRRLYHDPPERVAQAYNKYQQQAARLSPKAGYQRHRTAPWLTPEQAEKLGLHPVKDIRVRTAARELEGIHQRALRGMYGKLKEIGGLVVEADKAPAHFVRFNIPELAGYAVHPEIARFLTRFNDVFTTDVGLSSMRKAWQRVTNTWKGLVTAPNPEFHIRNAMGNFILNFLGGTVDPRRYVAAAEIQRGKDLALTLGGKRWSGREILRTFREQGLEGFGFFGAELGAEPTQALLREVEERFAGIGPKELLKHPIATGRRVGSAIESNAKLAHFIDRLAKGDTVEEAAESVRKHLFDYSELTPTEQTLRLIVPFYTWTRKALPLMAGKLLEEPGKFTALHHLIENAMKKGDIREEEIPTWLQEALTIPIKKQGDTIWTLNLGNPMAELNRIDVSSMMQNIRELFSMVHPVIRLAEAAANYQFFSGAPIERYRGETRPLIEGLGGPRIPARWEYIVRSIRPLQTVRAIGSEVAKQAAGEEGPRPLPLVGTFVRPVSAQKGKEEKLYEQREKLEGLVRKLREEQGMPVPTMTELQRRRGNAERSRLGR
ncbi:MAG TPA: hypothetical protein GX513_02280 [Firmicutes bacterium]|nr:hypothetical protein [Bacillota bacterium]